MLIAYVLVVFERVLGEFWLMRVYAPFMQFVQMTLEGKPACRLLPIAERLSSSKFNVPSTASMFFRVCVTQFVAPLFRQVGQYIDGQDRHVLFETYDTPESGVTLLDSIDGGLDPR